MNINKKIAIFLVVLMCILITNLDNCYRAYYRSETGFVWLSGLKIHGSIPIDLTIWIMLIIQFIILFIILNTKNK